MPLAKGIQPAPATLRAGAQPHSEGRVFWITGLSGAGKSTVATHLVRRFRDHAIPAILLDGDRVRAAIAPTIGHGVADRRELAFAYARLCGELAGQGFVVVCATVSMFQAVRDWSREMIPGYREIYLHVPMAEIRVRDPKGLYRAGGADIVGVDLPAEEPANPDLIIGNYGRCSADISCDRIWTDLVEPDSRFAAFVSATQ